MMYGWNMALWGWLGMALFWILVIAAAVYLVKLFAEQNQTRTRASTDHALDILRERFAKGDINQEEFERLKKGLS